MKKKPFTLFRKTISTGKIIYYYTIYDEKGKRYQYSTGETDQIKAMQFCMDKMVKGVLQKRSSLAFSEYVKDWFNYDKSRYLQSRINRGFIYSRSSADSKHNFLNKKAIPFFGDKSITAITPSDIESFLDYLKSENQSNATINKELKILKLIFKEAIKRHDITFNPAEQILLFKNDTREKGTFTQEEIYELFKKENSLEAIWDNNIMYYTINYLALQTGMRLGEIQALQKDDITCNQWGISICVKHSWDSKYGLKGTKTSKERIIPINNDLYKHLLDVSKSNFGSYIFSKTGGESPVRKNYIYDAFYKALSNIHIDKLEMKERNITFHSWRHTFASILVNREVPEIYIRSLTGHTSQNVFQTYTHIEQDLMLKAISF